MLEWFWYTLAATLAGVGTGLVGLSAATAMVPILPVLRRGDRSLSGHGHRAGLGHPGVRRDYRYIHQSQEYRPEARLDHAGLHYWATTAQASPWTPTPTSLGRCRRRPPKGWANNIIIIKNFKSIPTLSIETLLRNCYCHDRNSDTIAPAPA